MMISRSPFLSEAELAQFEREYREFPRSVGLRDSFEDPEVRELSHLVINDLRTVARRSKVSGKGLTVTVTAVRRGDGLHWAATETFRTVQEQCQSHKDMGDYRALHLVGASRMTGLPEIANIVGTRRLAALASKEGLASDFRLLPRWLHPLLTVLAVASALVLAAVAKNILPTGSGWQAFATPSIILTALAVGGVQLVTKRLEATKTDLTPADIENLAGKIREGVDKEPYNRLVSAVSKWLSTNLLPRSLIVLRFDDLDRFTQDVLKNYLEVQVPERKGGESWFVFETQGSETFDNFALRSNRSAWYQWAKRQELLILSPDARTRLAEFSGHPERAHLLTVRLIRDSSRDDDRFYAEALENLGVTGRDRSQTVANALGLLYLLALGGAKGGNPGLSDRALQTHLIQPGRVRSQILLQFLGADGLRKGVLPAALTAMHSTLGRFLEVAEDTDTYRVNTECGIYLAKHHRDLGLPHPRLAHLYWAILCHDIHENMNTAFWARKLGAHLVEAGDPGGIETAVELPESVDSIVFTAAEKAVHACMDWCVLDNIPDLLVLMLNMLNPEDPDEESNQRNRLRRLAWRAYTLLGDDVVLGVLVEMSSTTSVQTADPSDWPNLDRLFQEMLPMPRGSKGSAFRWDWGAGPRLPTELRAMSRVQVADFAALLPAIDAEAAPLLAASASEAPAALVDEVAAADDRLELAGEQVSIDVMTLSSALWSMTRELCRIPSRNLLAPPAFQESLDQIHYTALAVEEMEKRRSQWEARHGTDIVFDLVVDELRTVLAACAIRIWAVADNAHIAIDLQAVRDIVEASISHPTGLEIAAGTGGPNARLIDAVENQMAVSAFVYNSLGLNHLGNTLFLKKAEWAHMWWLNTPSSRDALVRDLTAQLQNPGTARLRALALASTAVGQREIVGKLALDMAQHAMALGLGTRVTVELGLRSIEALSGSPDKDFSHVLAYFAKDTGSDPPIDYLRSVAKNWPEESPRLVIPLRNAFSSSPDVGPAEKRIRKTLQSALAEVRASSQRASSLLAAFDLLDVLREIGSPVVLDYAKILADWKARKNDADYAYLLVSFLWNREDSYDIVLPSALELLRDFVADDGRTSFLLLAVKCASIWEHMPDETGTPHPCLADAISVIERTVDHFDDAASIDLLIDAYRLLSNATGREVYFLKYSGWKTAQSERDHLMHLPELISQGKIFSLFLYYVQTMAVWNLPTDRPWTEILPLLVPDEEQRQTGLRSWRDRQELVPDPFLLSGTSRIFSSDFLIVGAAIYANASDNEPGIKDARRKLDNVAEYYRPTLYSVLTGSDAVPAGIRAVLDRFQASLAAGSLPEQRGHASNPIRGASRET
jgi:hypothetical protein